MEDRCEAWSRHKTGGEARGYSLDLDRTYRWRRSSPNGTGHSVAGFLAEVGDIHKYDHGQQIIRLAGLNLKENSSGKRKGKTGISKRGRSRLRALLFRAVMPMVAKNPAFKALHHYYTTRSRNPLKKKQSIIALCGRLIRILFTLVTKQKEYVANDVMGPVHQIQIQVAA
ncbi:IS110 family transposase [Paenibacillus sp. MAHUQ-63]|nr:IS110 family transposase [Paenibacillus sp. MAHUQ-63]